MLKRKQTDSSEWQRNSFINKTNKILTLYDNLQKSSVSEERQGGTGGGKDEFWWLIMLLHGRNRQKIL